MAEDTKAAADAYSATKAISVRLTVDPNQLPAMVSAALSVAASAVISVKGGASDIEKAMKVLESGNRDIVSALLTVRAK